MISSAKALSSPQLGSPGMKMDGPYWWEPPSYWYAKRLGGASGFASEIGPGPTIPELDSLSTRPDTLDYGASTWYHTPQSGYADLKGLNNLKPGQVSVTTSHSAGATDVTLRNTGSSVAFFVRASVRRGAGGPEVLPTDWSDNYVTLWPGESVTLTARYRASDPGGATPGVEVFGHNVARVTK